MKRLILFALLLVALAFALGVGDGGADDPEITNCCYTQIFSQAECIGTARQQGCDASPAFDESGDTCTAIDCTNSCGDPRFHC